VAENFKLKHVKVKVRKEYFLKLILEDMHAGLRDYEIIQKHKIAERTFYRYKAALAKQIKEIKEKQTQQDIILEEEILQQRLTHDRVIAANKAQKLDNPEWQAVASQLAINLYVLIIGGRLMDHQTR
jgi:hypothetical protein